MKEQVRILNRVIGEVLMKRSPLSKDLKEGASQPYKNQGQHSKQKIQRTAKVLKAKDVS